MHAVLMYLFTRLTGNRVCPAGPESDVLPSNYEHEAASFDEMGLQEELLRGIFGMPPFTEGLNAYKMHC